MLLSKPKEKAVRPGVLGVTIGGDRGSGYIASKEQLLRTLDDKNEVPALKKLEKDIVDTSNRLGIGPMGFGEKPPFLVVKFLRLIDCLRVIL